MAIDPDVEQALLPIQEAIASLETRVAAIEASQGNSLFVARDNLETALFGAMQGMTDAQQVDFLNALAARITGAN